jgi:hypothetical protein
MPHNYKRLLAEIVAAVNQMDSVEGIEKKDLASLAMEAWNLEDQYRSGMINNINISLDTTIKNMSATLVVPLEEANPG